MADLIALALWCVLSGIVLSLIGYGAVGLFTREESKMRRWLVATPNRIASLGIAILFLLWLTIAVYNNVSATQP